MELLCDGKGYKSLVDYIDFVPYFKVKYPELYLR